MRVKNGKLPGVIICKICSIKFIDHCSKKYCSDDCLSKVLKKWGRTPTDPQVRKDCNKNHRQKKFKMGLCKDCAEPQFKGTRCLRHYLQNKKADRIRIAKRDYGEYWKRQIELLEINDLTKEIYDRTKNTISQRA